MNTRQRLRSLRFVEYLSCFAALSSAGEHSSVLSRPGLELGDAAGLDVEAHGVEVLAELDRQRQADIAQTDHADAAASHAQFHDFSVLL